VRGPLEARREERISKVTMQAQIEALERLAEIDAELKDLNEELSREREALSGKKQRLEELEGRRSRDQRSVDDMERTRGELVGEMRQMSIQVEKSREKLSRCRTEREANAAQRELEELRKLYRDRELEIDKLGGLVEQARGEIDKVTVERDALAGELGQNEGEVNNRLGELEKVAGVKNEARKEAVAKVKPELYRRYELIRKRRGTGIASTLDGTCSACNMRLPPMLFQQLARGTDFGQCPSCNRILYVRSAADAADTQSSSGP
jgi:predicted  nucleic acid-binding Zn-ribbon protein